MDESLPQFCKKSSGWNSSDGCNFSLSLPLCNMALHLRELRDAIILANSLQNCDLTRKEQTHTINILTAICLQLSVLSWKLVSDQQELQLWTQEHFAASNSAVWDLLSLLSSHLLFPCTNLWISNCVLHVVMTPQLLYHCLLQYHNEQEQGQTRSR